MRAWSRAAPGERARLAEVIERVERARRFVDAVPVVVELEGDAIPLAELFTTVLEPALELPGIRDPQGGDAPRPEHARAIAALQALGRAYAAPQPVRSGTLNLLLAYADSVVAADLLPSAVRTRLLLESVRALQALEGRAAADARTRWLLSERLVPALSALGRRPGLDRLCADAVAEAAAILSTPTVADEETQARLAPLVTGVHSRALLLAAYRRRALDPAGLAALARSVEAQAREDAAFAAASPPLLLELLCEESLAAGERRRLLDLVLDGLAPLAPFRDSAVDLLAAGHGGPPLPLEHYATIRGDAVPPPETSGGARRFRLLHVLLRRAAEDLPPEVAQVVRADLPMFLPLRAPDGSGGLRFLGALLPSAEQDHPDFVGPPPLAPGRDNRLLRRTLRLERAAVRYYGVRQEEIEIVAALPDDASEPVPEASPTLSHVLAFADTRLRRAADDDERRELARMLARIATPAAEEILVRHAGSAAVREEMLPIAEAGRAAPLRALLGAMESLAPAARDRALAAAARSPDPEVRAALRALASRAPLDVACPAAEALLGAADASGALALLGREELYARACGCALALRLSSLAGALRVEPREAPGERELAAAAARAFTEKDGEAWLLFARWLEKAFADPDGTRRARSDHEPLRIAAGGGFRSCAGAEFADHWTANVEGARGPARWPALARFLLSPVDPGRGIPDASFARLLDALEGATKNPELARAWTDALVILACAQYGIEMGGSFLDLANARLEKLAGESAPAGASRRAGVLWPVWAARKAGK